MWDDTDTNMLIRLVLAGANLSELSHELDKTKTEIMHKVNKLMQYNDIYGIGTKDLFKNN